MLQRRTATSLHSRVLEKNNLLHSTPKKHSAVGVGSKGGITFGKSLKKLQEYFLRPSFSGNESYIPSLSSIEYIHNAREISNKENTDDNATKAYGPHLYTPECWKKIISCIQHQKSK
jgi:hypothetical protein